MFENLAISAHDVDASLDQILFDLRHGQGETIERRVNLRQPALVPRKKRERLVARAGVGRAGREGFGDFRFVSAAQTRQG